MAYRADDEVRAQAGQNVITVLGAKIDSLGARIDAQSARIDARITELKAEMETRFAELKSENAEMNARIEAQTSRIDTLQKVLWPLVIAISVALLSAVGGGLFALLQG